MLLEQKILSKLSCSDFLKAMIRHIPTVKSCEQAFSLIESLKIRIQSEEEKGEIYFTKQKEFLLQQENYLKGCDKLVISKRSRIIEKFKRETLKILNHLYHFYQNKLQT